MHPNHKGSPAYWSLTYNPINTHKLEYDTYKTFHSIKALSSNVIYLYLRYYLNGYFMVTLKRSIIQAVKS